MIEYINLWICGTTGVLLFCVFNMINLKSAADSANVKFGIKLYVRKDYLAIIAQLLSIVVWFLIFGEWEKKFPGIVDIKRTLFVLAGISGSGVIQLAANAFSNGAKKYIQKYVDVKTNVSDMVANIKPTDTIERVIEKGTAVVGQDVTQIPPAPKDIAK